MKNTFLRNGFTLIEVMVVIAIIGILSSILYVSFGTAREDARNKALKAELKEVQLALELYKAQNGRYPEIPGGACGVSLGSFRHASSTDADCAGVYIKSLTPDFIANLPSHAKSSNTSCDVVYITDSGGTFYKLTAHRCAAGVTSTTGVQAGDEFARCLTSCGSCTPANINFYESYAVYSNGGECK